MTEKDDPPTQNDGQFNAKGGDLEDPDTASLKYAVSDAEEKGLISPASPSTQQRWPWTSSQSSPGQSQVEEVLSQKVVSLCEKGSISDLKLGVWQDIFEQLRRERSSAADLLCLMNFLNPEGIPKFILEAYQRYRGGNKVNLDRDIEFLTECSLIVAAKEDGVLKIHPTVHSSARMWISSVTSVPQWKIWPRQPQKDEEAWKRTLLHVFSSEYSDPHDTGSQGICQWLDSHVDSAIEIEPRDKSCFQKWGRLLHDLALYRCKTGRNQEAEQLLQRLLEANRRVLGPEDPSTLSGMQCLGTVLSRGGKYKEAEEVQRCCLEVRQRLSGPEHPTTLFTMNSLALTLATQGRFEEADDLCRKVLEAKREVSGLDNVWTLAGLTGAVGKLPGHRRVEEVERLQWLVMKRTRKRVWSVNSSIQDDSQT
ncbi:uncharacterized protein NECHADRAFT_83615 [Fusarium vanettenii 77-13-4]|uniref:MalT-like TPR region domain-containing protein n=1 Tax=Fusarium vanettenii (strain ATCC MYA-4622 / CBS 123669 / FGSC 9596 / NRRL 45880 / 77-13-4) TaxID=660122 RepID=C7YY97_FUSV7|nr:uncharacterized protein NECHADRAFT_83615 [Fusarium vanettenii 77-13-4]EEU43150.1 hypothetical protein NECHADRAFT_83615 [Fusarium vanettenii 77-13-4]